MTEGSHPPLDGEPQDEPRGEPMFVGYLDGMPRRTRTAMRGVVLGVFVAVAASAAALTSAQLPFDASGYDLIAVRTAIEQRRRAADDGARGRPGQPREGVRAVTDGIPPPHERR